MHDNPYSMTDTYPQPLLSQAQHGQINEPLKSFCYDLLFYFLAERWAESFEACFQTPLYVPLLYKEKNERSNTGAQSYDKQLNMPSEYHYYYI